MSTAASSVRGLRIFLRISTNEIQRAMGTSAEGAGVGFDVDSSSIEDEEED